MFRNDLKKKSTLWFGNWLRKTILTLYLPLPHLANEAVIPFCENRLRSWRFHREDNVISREVSTIVPADASQHKSNTAVVRIYFPFVAKAPLKSPRLF